MKPVGHSKPLPILPILCSKKTFFRRERQLSPRLRRENEYETKSFLHWTYGNGGLWLVDGCCRRKLVPLRAGKLDRGSRHIEGLPRYPDSRFQRLSDTGGSRGSCG